MFEISEIVIVLSSVLIIKILTSQIKKQCVIPILRFLRGQYAAATFHPAFVSGKIPVISLVVNKKTQALGL